MFFQLKLVSSGPTLVVSDTTVFWGFARKKKKGCVGVYTFLNKL